MRIDGIAEDIFEIREVWIDEAYRLTDGFSPMVVVDLGAHIGLTTLWLAKRYGPATGGCCSGCRLARSIAQGRHRWR